MRARQPAVAIHGCRWHLLPMDLQLRGKRALVTGSTAGIGLAIAVDLAQEGVEVFLNGRTRERVDAAIDRVRTEAPGARVDGIVADLNSARGADTITARL